jgi:EmrB/QacA subfamily drug resistance transporter
MSSSLVATRPEPPGEASAAPDPHRWWALAVTALAQLMVVLDATIITIALPSAQRSLGFTNDGRQWVVTAYSLAFGSLLLLGGRLSDVIGRKRMFLLGVVGFAAASGLGGTATSFVTLVVARALQGGFGAMLAPAALSLLSTTFTEPRERARAFGVFGAIAGSGAALGLLLGGVLTEFLDWRWTLYVNVFIALFAVAGAMVFVRNSPRARRVTLDVPGVLLAVGGLFCVVFGFAGAETHPWGNWMVWGFLAAGVALLLAFVDWEARASHPLLPPGVVADRNRGAALVTVFVASMGLFGVFLFLTYYLQAVEGYSPLTNGLAFLPMVAMLVAAAQLSTNVLVFRLGPKVVVPTGLLLASFGMVWMTQLDVGSGYAAHVLPPLLVLGAGVGLAMPPAFNLATLGVRASDQGVTSAMANTTQQIGGAIATALLSTLAASAVAGYLVSHPTDPQVQADAAVHGYATAYWWSAGFFALGALVTVFLFRRRSADRLDAAVAAPADGQPATATAAAVRAGTAPE